MDRVLPIRPFIFIIYPFFLFSSPYKKLETMQKVKCYIQGEEIAGQARNDGAFFINYHTWSDPETSLGWHDTKI